MCREERCLIGKWGLNSFLFLVSVFGLFGGFGGVVWAEPQFGGDVSNVKPCTCGSNAGGYYFEIGDPHGDGEGGSGSYVAPPSAVRDCDPIQDGEEALGLHNENDEECKQQIGNACITVGSGKGVDIYGTSPNNCGSHKTSASSSVVDNIKQKRDNGEEVVGSGTTNSSEKTSKSSNVVDDIKQKRDSDDNEIKSSEDINNPEATNLSESVVRTVVQKRDNKEKVSGSKSGSILNDAGAQIGSNGGIAVLGSRDEIVQQEKNKSPDEVSLGFSEKGFGRKNSFWRIMVALIGFGLGAYFVGRAGKKMFGK